MNFSMVTLFLTLVLYFKVISIYQFCPCVNFLQKNASPPTVLKQIFFKSHMYVASGDSHLACAFLRDMTFLGHIMGVLRSNFDIDKKCIFSYSFCTISFIFHVYVTLMCGYLACAFLSRSTFQGQTKVKFD